MPTPHNQNIPGRDTDDIPQSVGLALAVPFDKGDKRWGMQKWLGHQTLPGNCAQVWQVEVALRAGQNSARDMPEQLRRTLPNPAFTIWLAICPKQHAPQYPTETL